MTELIVIGLGFIIVLAYYLGHRSATQNEMTYLKKQRKQYEQS